MRIVLSAVLLMTSFSYILQFSAARAQQPSTEPLHVQASRAVFRLEHNAILNRVGQATPEVISQSNGTAFPIRHNDRAFLITARHVAEKHYDLRARVPSRLTATGATEVVELRIPKESWTFHPIGPSQVQTGAGVILLRGVDVAVAPLPGIKEREFIAFLWCDPCPTGQVSQFPTTDPAPPAEVLVTGFPLDLGIGLHEQRPMFRSAIIALVAGERLLRFADGAFADERTFVIDRRVQPGNSGSPVFSLDRFSGRITLVGLVSAASEALDLTIVEPASRIREAISNAIAKPPTRLPDWHPLAR